MLILKYFVVVGAALTAGLIALNAHLTAPVPVKPAMVRAVSTTAAPPPVADPAPAAPVAAEPPPKAPAKAASPTRRSSASHNKRHAGRTAAR
jgi:hypothetical protein